MQVRCVEQGTQSWCPGTTQSNREEEGAFRMGGTHVYLWLIHVHVWQKPSQHYKVIILLLKEIKFKNKYKAEPRRKEEVREILK